MSFVERAKVMPIIKGIVEDGVIRPAEKLPLQDGAEVEIRYPLPPAVDPRALQVLVERMERGIEMGGWKWRGRDELHDRQGLR